MDLPGSELVVVAADFVDGHSAALHNDAVYRFVHFVAANSSLPQSLLHYPLILPDLGLEVFDGLLQPGFAGLRLSQLTDFNPESLLQTRSVLQLPQLLLLELERHVVQPWPEAQVFFLRCRLIADSQEVQVKCS